VTTEELKRLRELREAWCNGTIDYLDYAQQCGDALPSLLDEVERLAESLIAAANRAEAERWIPVSERLPEDDRTVLLWTNENYRTYDDPRIAILGRYVPSMKEWRFHGSNSDWSDAVTHWRPLPAAPKEVQS
jgi:hypothetical protein